MKSGALVIAILYFAAQLVYGLARGPVVVVSSIKASSPAIFHLASAQSSSLKSGVSSDNLIKLKRRRRRVSHFDVVADTEVAIGNFAEIHVAAILAHNFQWATIEPPTPPPA